ncbi:MAG TPA: hypothetical protein VHZ24_06005 [Pirellulales bacterium]|jgi:hypothetical protein|nr:hypothetical protein [Pirellulales bacterium]
MLLALESNFVFAFTSSPTIPRTFAEHAGYAGSQERRDPIHFAARQTIAADDYGKVMRMLEISSFSIWFWFGIGPTTATLGGLAALAPAQ